MATLTDRWLRPRSARTQFPPYDFGDPSIVGQAEARTSTIARIYHKGHEQAWDGRAVMDELIAKHGEINFPADKREAFEKIEGTHAHASAKKRTITAPPRSIERASEASSGRSADSE